MAFPANFTRIWVRGRIVDLAKLAGGETSFGIPKPITFTPSPQVLLNRDTNQIIKTEAFSVMPAAEDGYFAIELPATNDPDIIPIGWTYAVVEPTGRKYNIVVDFDTPLLEEVGDPLEGLQVLDLINIIPSPGSSAGTVQLVGGMVANLGDVNLTDLQGGSTLVYNSDTGLWQAQVIDLDVEVGNMPYGPTASRGNPAVARVFFDTTINRPIIGDGAAWRDFDGNILGTNPGGGTVGTKTQAAQEILDRIDAGLTIGSDWTWLEASTTVTAWNDALIADYLTANPGASTTNWALVETWLTAFVNGTTGGGTSNAPQNLVAVLDQENRLITLTWDAVPNATHYKLYEDRSPNGVGGAEALTDTMSVRGPLSGNGTVYRYWVTAFVDGVESAPSNYAGGTLGGSGGEDPGGTTGTPGDVLNIGNGAGQNHFNVGIGYASGHTDKSPSEIANGFEDEPYFYTNGTKVHFQVYMNGGRTSSGTKYPRSELREMEPNGTTRIAWNGSSGTHWMEGKSTVTHLPPNKPWVCFTQIHDASSDLARVQTEGTSTSNLKIVLRNTDPDTGDETATTIMNSYTIGTELTWRWEVVNGTGKFFLNGTLVKTFPADTSGCYFKTGCYVQSNSTIDASSEYGAVEMRDLKHWHTGWPTPL